MNRHTLTARSLMCIDALSASVGKSFSWLIVVLTAAMTYEVFVRYALNAPTTWAFDISYITYGALFLMAGAYTLSQNAHVRGDFLYRTWRPRVQAAVDLALYAAFFLPGVCALIYAGWGYAMMSVRYREVSVFSPAGIPIFPLKCLIPVAGVLILLQGLVEIARCVLCIRRGVWPQRLRDVEEMETVILHEQEFLRAHERAGQQR